MLFEPLNPAMPEAFPPGLFSMVHQSFPFLSGTRFSLLKARGLEYETQGRWVQAPTLTVTGGVFTSSVTRAEASAGGENLQGRCSLRGGWTVEKNQPRADFF